MKRLVVLISGSGSNLQAILDYLAQGTCPAQVTAVISNKSDAYGLERARNAGIPTFSLSHKDFSSREAFDAELMTLIDSQHPDLVILAGFMRILTPEFTRHYSGRLFNIHPSLLPKYKGLNTHQRAIEAGDKLHGATVHFVTEELDGGPLIVQGQLDINPEDNPDSLAQRVHILEHQIYPMAIDWYCCDRLTLSPDGTVLLDNASLPSTGHIHRSS
ncbi:phosphoribosylglycinamide formyltransferase [Pokkaliibacter plantistimulans]|uniref:Phosphoribosylglycinamide formyltransferase n=1 Tax=Pokkaliibacter plantistimulans TaxID=1635171 RepID=A0ABX5LYI3_9GAMM|nr:phosphoribosylglycinamide formyltransferase [Pokkaliibacter plantistimulans]PXF31199.1 phosphoribosylglycinamide formyltransferase [Pokkaliibacter plantistimulans]